MEEATVDMMARMRGSRTLIGIFMLAIRKSGGDRNGGPQVKQAGHSGLHTSCMSFGRTAPNGQPKPCPSVWGPGGGYLQRFTVERFRVSVLVTATCRCSGEVAGRLANAGRRSRGSGGSDECRGMREGLSR